MRVINKEELKLHQDQILRELYDGAVFIYPTDTIYGIGCDAQNGESVRKIRKVKGRNEMPFSVIAPNKQWIYDNCEVSDEARKWIEEKLPGPYTLILKLRNKKAVSKHVNKGIDTLGVRIPDHWCSKAVSMANIPLVTTSANVTGENFMTSLDNLNPRIRAHMNFIIYEDELKGRPSKIVDLTKENVEVKER